MDALTSILVIIDPADETHLALAKARTVARHCHAQVELFLCRSESAFTLSHAYERQGVTKARRTCLDSGRHYLDSLRRSLCADVATTVHVACDSPLYAAVVQRVLESQPDLVIKGAAGRRAGGYPAPDANDWQLIRTCPVPLMLTRGKPWAGQPRFAAAVDMSARAEVPLARSIVRTADSLARVHDAAVEMVYSSPTDAGRDRDRDAWPSLLDLASEFGIAADRVNMLYGRAEQTLPHFVATSGYDVLVLGALARQRQPATLPGSLTHRLVEALTCDVVLVKSESDDVRLVAPSDARDAQQAQAAQGSRRGIGRGGYAAVG